jgi:hypothetical protein
MIMVENTTKLIHKIHLLVLLDIFLSIQRKGAFSRGSFSYADTVV